MNTIGFKLDIETLIRRIENSSLTNIEEVKNNVEKCVEFYKNNKLNEGLEYFKSIQLENKIHISYLIGCILLSLNKFVEAETEYYKCKVKLEDKEYIIKPALFAILICGFKQFKRYDFMFQVLRENKDSFCISLISYFYFINISSDPILFIRSMISYRLAKFAILIDPNCILARKIISILSFDQEEKLENCNFIIKNKADYNNLFRNLRNTVSKDEFSFKRKREEDTCFIYNKIEYKRRKINN